MRGAPSRSPGARSTGITVRDPRASLDVTATGGRTPHLKTWQEPTWVHLIGEQYPFFCQTRLHQCQRSRAHLGSLAKTRFGQHSQLSLLTNHA